MEKRSPNQFETKSLIDSDNSSESIELTVSETSPNPDYAIITLEDEDRKKSSSTLEENIEREQNQDEYEISSEIPSLVHASDCDETLSQASVASSVWSTPQAHPTKIAEQNFPDSQNGTRIEDDVHSDQEKIKSKEMVLNAISEETMNSLNTVKTSNLDIYESRSNLESDVPITEIRTRDDNDDFTRDQEEIALSNLVQSDQSSSIDQGAKNDECDNKLVTLNKSSRRDSSTMFENSINCVIDFFSCSTPVIQAEDSNGSDQEKWYAANEVENQLQNLQTCIEVDILRLMGCPAESAQGLIDSFGPSCNSCYWSTEKDDEYWQEGNLGDKDSSSQRPKIRNRNVYGRHKAMKRIRQLRQSGLNRHFSLAPVANYLAEEADFAVAGSGSSIRSSERNTGLSKDSPNGEKKRGALIPLSKRPRALGGGNRETSLGGSSTASYELAIMTTRSYDFSVCEEDEKSLPKDAQSYAGAIFGSNDLFSRLFRFSSSNNSSSAKQELAQDLFYDSDPGTYDGNSTIALSEHRIRHGSNASQRCRTIGSVDNVSLGQIRGYSFANTKSQLQSLHVESFDMNDSVAISLLIKELITDSFLLIWHPKEKLADWSVSSNAPPRRVKAWFEMGSCLKKRLLQPKFVWRSNDQMLFSSRQLSMQRIRAPESVELLNIVRIVVPATIDREMHPFVKKDCAFVIVTNDEQETLFELATKDERDKFVFAFKIMVARLASKIIVGDKDVFDEFFTPLAATTKKKKKRRKARRRNGNSGVIHMDDLKEDCASDTSSVGSNNTSSFSKAFVGTVTEESNRKDELWGI